MRLTKKEIARRQIDTAIELFFEAKDFVSITTLAGASEEIIGALLRCAGKSNTIDHLVDFAKREGGPEWDASKVSAVINKARNNFKHANDPNEDEMEYGFDEAIAMLTRAVVNYTSLYDDPTLLMLKFGKKVFSCFPELYS
jgi:hypothetical protein